MFDTTILDKAIRRIPDFPKPGILFYDITGILVNPEAFSLCIQKMVDIYKDAQIDA
ncbi:MAG TPA: adenine phosphoribosyltransferase, partial [Treponemataceae bacterium]|nr:adenine phosphoribosyltransferase [Treponemataceae bacterium]